MRPIQTPTNIRHRSLFQKRLFNSPTFASESLHANSFHVCVTCTRKTKAAPTITCNNRNGTGIQKSNNTTSNLSWSCKAQPNNPKRVSIYEYCNAASLTAHKLTVITVYNRTSHDILRKVSNRMDIFNNKMDKTNSAQQPNRQLNLHQRLLVKEVDLAAFFPQKYKKLRTIYHLKSCKYIVGWGFRSSCWRFRFSKAYGLQRYTCYYCCSWYD